MITVFSFAANHRLMGVEAGYVFRVLEEVAVTPVCLTPPAFAGILHYRGEIFEVIHLTRLLGSDDEPSALNGRMMLWRWKEKKLAVIPDRVIGLVWIDRDAVAPEVIASDGSSIQIVSPEVIWDTLVSQSYGPS